MSTQPTPQAGPSLGNEVTTTEAQPRFCSSCSRTKPAQGGALVRCANGAKRWKCAECRARSKSHLASLQRGTSGKDPA